MCCVDNKGVCVCVCVSYRQLLSLFEAHFIISCGFKVVLGRCLHDEGAERKDFKNNKGFIYLLTALNCEIKQLHLGEKQWWNITKYMYSSTVLMYSTSMSKLY